MWNLISVRLEAVFVSEQDRSMVCAKRTIGLETFWTHPMVLLCDWVKWKPDLVYLEIVLILTQDRGTVCIECTKGSQIILGATVGAHR